MSSVVILKTKSVDGINYFIPDELQNLFGFGVFLGDKDEDMTVLLNRALPITKELKIKYLWKSEY